MCFFLVGESQDSSALCTLRMAVPDALLGCLPLAPPAGKGSHQRMRRGVCPLQSLGKAQADKELLQLKCCNSLAAIIQFAIWILLKSPLGKGMFLTMLQSVGSHADCNLISINCLVLGFLLAITWTGWNVSKFIVSCLYGDYTMLKISF